jgi:hypothetical protein
MLYIFTPASLKGLILEKNLVAPFLQVTKYQLFKVVFRIRRILKFLDLPDPDSVPHPDPSIIKQK